MPGYREAVLGWAPEIARYDPGGAQGVFFGYDFHVAEDGFGLIEINTNAGGAPFGRDLASAQALNQTLHEVFAESAVFRIDRYLGKEAVQIRRVVDDER